MQLNISNEDFSIPNKESSEYIFENSLLEFAKKFEFVNFTTMTLMETCKDDNFKQNLFSYCTKRLNLDLVEIELYFYNTTPLDSEYLKNMIDKQYQRIQTLCIEFVYTYLPFNYIIKLNKMKKLSKLYSVDIYPISELRKDIINLLTMEISKINNIDKTMETIKQSLSSKKQMEKVGIIQSASQSVSKKTIIENKFLIAIMDTIPAENLESIIIDILDDQLIQDNLE